MIGSRIIRHDFLFVKSNQFFARDFLNIGRRRRGHAVWVRAVNDFRYAFVRQKTGVGALNFQTFNLVLVLNPSFPKKELALYKQNTIEGLKVQRGLHFFPFPYVALPRLGIYTQSCSDKRNFL